MPDPCFLSDCKVYFGGYDLTGAFNKVNLSAAKVQLANGRFGDTVEPFFPGLQQIDAAVAGFFAAGAGEPDAALFPRVDTDTSEWPLTVAPPSAPTTAAGAAGNVAYTIRSAQFSYKLDGQHGQSLPFDVMSRVRSGGLYRQTIDQPKGLVTATTTSTGRLLGLLGAGQKLVATLHVFAITGGSWVLTIESDDNSGFTTPVTRATFSAVTTAPNRAVSELVGPVATDTYWRAVLTKTGGTNITYAVALSIENA